MGDECPVRGRVRVCFGSTVSSTYKYMRHKQEGGAAGAARGRGMLGSLALPRRSTDFPPLHILLRMNRTVLFFADIDEFLVLKVWGLLPVPPFLSERLPFIVWGQTAELIETRRGCSV